jgi:hypothetical protein
MISYRITKYNPQNRNACGSYQKDEWICFTDVGKVFEKTKLTYQDYVKVENAYIKVIKLIMSFLALKSLHIIYLKKYGLSNTKRYSKKTITLYKSLRNNQKVFKKDIAYVSKLRLRNDIGGFFQNKNMFVHFGYDYYMYIGSSKELPQDLRNKIENLGLFVEDFESPYLPDRESTNL